MKGILLVSDLHCDSDIYSYAQISSASGLFCLIQILELCYLKGISPKLLHLVKAHLRHNSVIGQIPCLFLLVVLTSWLRSVVTFISENISQKISLILQKLL